MGDIKGYLLFHDEKYVTVFGMNMQFNVLGFNETTIRNISHDYGWNTKWSRMDIRNKFDEHHILTIKDIRNIIETSIVPTNQDLQQYLELQKFIYKEYHLKYIDYSLDNIK